MLYPLYPSTVPRPEERVECRTKAVQKVDTKERRRHSPSMFKLVPLVSDTHVSNGAPVSEPCTAMVTHFYVFMFFNLIFFATFLPLHSTLLLYSTPLFYPSKSWG